MRNGWSKLMVCRRLTAIGTLIVITLVVSACSGADSPDSDTAESETPIAVVEPPTPTATTPPTATPTAPPAIPTLLPTNTPQPTATPSPTVPPTPTPTVVATETPVPTATATATPQPTATPTTPPVEVSLPSGGSKLGILGRPIQRVIAADDAGQILYAVTSSGITRSNDGGKSWNMAGDVPPGEIVVAMNQPDVLYVGDQGACARGDSGVPMLRSTDGGQTWQEFAAGHGIQPLIVEADWSSTVIGTSCLLQVSFNGGQDWIEVNQTPNYDIYAAVSSNPDALDGEMLVLGVTEGGTGGLFKYDILEDNVRLINQPAEFYGIGAVTWSGNRIILATSTGVGVSDDNGDTWQWSRQGLEDVTFSVNPLQEPIPDDEMGQPFGFSVVRVNPENPDQIWIGGPTGAFWSTDAGATWQMLDDIQNVESIAISTVTDRVFISTEGVTRAWTLDGE